MFATLCALLLSTTYTPTDDIWVYSHASGQTEGSLEVWGSGGKFVSSVSDDAPASWSLIQFDLSGAKPGAKVASAHLILTHVAKCNFNIDDSLANPIEARPVQAGFDETKWTAEDSDQYLPLAGDNDYYGFKSVDPGNGSEPIVVDIDLMKGKVDTAAKIADAVKNGGKFAVAIVSKLDVQATNGMHFYKFYSRSAEEAKRPKLVIEWSDGTVSQL